MRFALVAIAASLALSGCGKKQATGNTNALDEAVTAEDFASNDATAIDAATGADANMAADVDINLIENESGNGSARAADGHSRSPRSPAPAANNSAAEPAEPAEPAGNAASSNSN
jgi:hypothetical protein